MFCQGIIDQGSSAREVDRSIDPSSTLLYPGSLIRHQASNSSNARGLFIVGTRTCCPAYPPSSAAAALLQHINNLLLLLLFLLQKKWEKPEIRMQLQGPLFNLHLRLIVLALRPAPFEIPAGRLQSLPAFFKKKKASVELSTPVRTFGQVREY